MQPFRAHWRATAIAVIPTLKTPVSCSQAVSATCPVIMTRNIAAALTLMTHALPVCSVHSLLLPIAACSYYELSSYLPGCGSDLSLSTKKNF